MTKLFKSNGVSPTTLLMSEKVITVSRLETLSCTLVEPFVYLLVGACVTLISAVPAPTIVTVLPDTVATLE